jgi:hypothetical protein
VHCRKNGFTRCESVS